MGPEPSSASKIGRDLHILLQDVMRMMRAAVTASRDLQQMVSRR